MISRRSAHLIGAVVSLICLGFFARTVAAYAGSIASIAAEAWWQLPLALPLYAAGYLASAAAWVRILRVLGGTTTLRTGAAILWTAQFGKYLPGNVGHHVGRVAIAGRFGLAAGIVVKSMALEMGLVVALIVLFAIPSVGNLLERLEMKWLFTAAAFVSVILGVLLWYRWMRGPASAAARGIVPLIGPMLVKTWLPVVAVLAGAIILTGASLVPLTLGLAVEPLGALHIVSLFCVAWLAGFVVPGAPAGLGVRELILAEGLAPMIGHDQAVMAALLFRLLTVVADLIAFVAGVLLLKYSGDAAGSRHSGTGSAAPPLR